MKDKSQEIFTEITKAKNILLHCHVSPDPDSVGSSLAMKRVLEQLGKKVTLIRGDSEISKAFVFPGIETIVPKNLFEVDLKEFDLFLILDSGGIDRVSIVKPIVFPDHLMTIVIDHHASNKGYAKINLVDTSYSSTAELLHDLFISWGLRIDHDIALNLFMGIYTDTGGFRFGASPQKTLDVAARLAFLSPDFQKTISIMENSNRKEALIFESLALSSLKMYLDEKLVIVSVSYDDIQKCGLSKDDMFPGPILNRLSSLATSEIVIVAVEEEKGHVKMSLRSRDGEKYDVSKVAGILGGGGHKAASGLRLSMSLDEACQKVVKTVEELYT